MAVQKKIKKSTKSSTHKKTQTKKITAMKEYYCSGLDKHWLSLDGIKRKLHDVLEIACNDPDALTMNGAYFKGNMQKEDAYRWCKKHPELKAIVAQIKRALSVKRFNGAAYSKLNYRVIMPTQHNYCEEHKELHDRQEDREERKIRLQEKRAETDAKGNTVGSLVNYTIERVWN